VTEDSLTLADDPLTLDANAVAGILHEVFGTEMTAQASQCAHCGNRALLGTLRVYDMEGPGIVMRCSTCTEIVIRLVRRADGTFLVDARGAAYIRY
jgi:xanthine/CO dehydrogenase XdhC/CoxF family maturation factor